MGKFEDGHNKKGGRQKGTSNKKTQILEAFIDDVLEGGKEKFKRELNKLDGKDYVQAYKDILEYSLPKKQRIEAEIESKEKVIKIERTIIHK